MDGGTERGPSVEERPNIKPLLEAARAQLEVGELLASPTFDLQTAMSAREIGDPKMDRFGSVSGIDTRGCAERILDGAGRLDLGEQEILAVMDRLLQMEIAWHDRYMLCQTVYTSLYVASVERVQGVLPDLHAYCLSVDVLCTFLYDAVYSNRVCCDEDVSVVLCGVPLSKHGPGHAVSILEDRLHSGKEQGVSPVTQRLRWRCATLKTLVAVANASSRTNLEDAMHLCDEAIGSLEAISFLDDDDLGRAEGFAPTLYYGSLGHVPMRDVKLRPIHEAAGAWKSFLYSLKDAVSQLSKVNTWVSLKSFMDHVAARDYHGFIRCLLYHLLVNQPDAPWAPSEVMLANHILLTGGDTHHGCGDDGTHRPGYDDESRNKYVLGKELLADHFENVPDLTVFFEQCVLAVQGLCHVKCLNRARQHRRLRHILHDWRNMLGHAFNTETSLEYRMWITAQGFSWDKSDRTIDQRSGRIAPLTSWVVYETSWTCIEHLLMGGPLELYQPHEISTVYWYVSYLMGSADHAAKEHANISRSKRRAMNLDNRDGTDDSVRDQIHDVLQMAVDSVSMTCIALQGLGLFPTKTLEFNNEQDIYEQRFGFMSKLEFPRYQTHGDYIVYEQNVIEFARQDPRKLAEEALLYTAKVLTRFVMTAEADAKQVEMHLADQVWAIARRSLAATLTALKLLVTLMSGMTDLRDLASTYSALWIFPDDDGECLAPQSRARGYALVCRSLPRVSLVQKAKRSVS